ncbi:NADPH-dependent diflavin oxidoreductase 1 [Scaptodrosophila lebanonensis]|uniref:NADPH-dependent diflavin oxidoreductase 1 n=1 Tax=Drosophila lebanonensis TaxID=7225 RepID=A0A6J2T9Y0_DROLE|nr:NADPH-dependent diflavin oxidoreductase 1 [Scaptodrosophila lebanonensis]
MRLLILYGSQTGTAQDVAEQLWRESKQWGLDGPVLGFDDYEIQQLVEERLVIFVVATTGDGVEPDNMKRAWRFLLKRSLPPDSLSGLQFACLGLGDSSYPKFNYAAKKLHKRLQNLGAEMLCPVGLCDDQHDHGHLGTSLPWSESLWTTLSQNLTLKQCTEHTKIEHLHKWDLKVLPGYCQALDEERLQWTQKTLPIKLKLGENTRTTTPDHFQDVRFLRFSYADEAAITWQPGDIVDLQPQNSPEKVSDFFELLSEHKLEFNEQTVVQVSSAHKDMPLPIAYTKPIPLKYAAKYIWDLTAKPRQRFFEVLSQDCDDELEQEKLLEFSSPQGLDDLIAYVNRPRRTLLEVLQDFRHASAKLTLSKLFEMMPLIQPRSFSIASDASTCSLDLLVAVVNYKTILQVPRLGLCSNWLKTLQPGVEINGSIKPGTMGLPKDLTIPLIMVGPGTGIAPFRSVVQNRLHAQQSGDKVGTLLVFFGCRNKKHDFHFEDDFIAWRKANIVEPFFAFSRDGEHKVYVQHLIKREAVRLEPLLRQQNAHIYVSGSSNSMPKAVKEAFIEVLNGDVNYVEGMIKAKRYQEETWS